MTAIRVLIVDDELLVRSGLGMIVGSAPDLELVGACSGGEAEEQVKRLRPHVVLLDVRMPDLDGISVLRRLRALPDPPAVSMLTTFDTDEYIGTALRAGAAGFLLKDTAPDQLVHAVRILAAGGSMLARRDPHGDRRLRRGRQSRCRRARPGPLADRPRAGRAGAAR